MNNAAVLAAVIVLATAETTHAEPLPPIATKVVAAGNQFLAQHLGTLSAGMVSLQLDAEQRRAKVAVGGGNTRVVRLRVAGNVTVEDGTARISSRIGLALAGKQLDIKLPAIDVAPASYRDQRGVELRLPLLRRTF